MGLKVGHKVGREEVRALMESSLDWDSSLPVRTTWLAQYSSQMMCSQPTLPVFAIENIKHKQRKDDAVAWVIYFLERKRRPSRRERIHETAQVLCMLKHWEKLEIRDGVLYKRSKDKVGKKRYQLIVPKSLKSTRSRTPHLDFSGVVWIMR